MLKLPVRASLLANTLSNHTLEYLPTRQLICPHYYNMSDHLPTLPQHVSSFAQTTTTRQLICPHYHEMSAHLPTLPLRFILFAHTANTRQLICPHCQYMSAHLPTLPIHVSSFAHTANTCQLICPHHHNTLTYLPPTLPRRFGVCGHSSCSTFLQSLTCRPVLRDGRSFAHTSCTSAHLPQDSPPATANTICNGVGTLDLGEPCH